MQIKQIDTHNRRQVQAFLSLPFRVYQDISQWVPPFALEAKRQLSKRNPFFQHSEAAFFLATDGASQPVGRIAALEHRLYNSYNHERTAFFTLFESIDDIEPAHGLFAAAEAWARQRNLVRLIGPKGFSVLDGMGLLVKGFAHRPAFGIPYNPPYYPALIESAGYTPINDVVSGYLSVNATFPEKIHRAAELITRRRGLRIATYRTRRDLLSLIPRLQALYNSALEGTSGNAPLTDAEARSMGDQLKWFADPKLIKIIMKDDDPVGFLFAYPDISAALQRTKGRMFPFGWVRMLAELRRTKWVNINGAGMIAQYRGSGGTAILFSEMQKSLLQGRFEHADLVQIGVENDKMQRELRDLGVDFYKVHRMYHKALG